MKTKFWLTVGLSASLLFLGLPFSAVSAASAGQKCSKAGLLSGTKQAPLVCKKVGKKLVWQKAVVTTTSSTKMTGRVPGALSIPLNAYSLGRSATNQPAGIRLNWYYPYDFGSSLVSGYRFEVQTASTPWLFVSNLSAYTYNTTVKDDNLAGQTLRFRIAAFSSVGVGIFSETNWIEYPALNSSGGSVATLPSAANSGISTTTTTTPTVSGPIETAGQYNARRSAASYLRLMAFSRSGLIKQLQYENFSLDDATYGVDAQNADWNTQASKSAASYLKLMSFSRLGLIAQLVYEGFSQSQAEYGVSSNGL